MNSCDKSREIKDNGSDSACFRSKTGDERVKFGFLECEGATMSSIFEERKIRIINIIRIEMHSVFMMK